MSHEAEAYTVVLIYVLMGSVIVLSTLLVFAYIWFRHEFKFRKDTSDFTKLMIRLYEKEIEEKERQDKGGFGT